MKQMPEDKSWIPLRPALDEVQLAHFTVIAEELSRLTRDTQLVDEAVIRMFRQKVLNEIKRRHPTNYQALRVVTSLLCDLVGQGWHVRVTDSHVDIQHPDTEEDTEAERERVRRSLRLARDEQLCEPAVRAFIKSMESRRLGPHSWVSIHSLMRNGKELSAQLRQVHAGQVPLEDVIKPYLQFVTENLRCEWTGLRLTDVWRYFRHTWLTPMRSTPGRSMMILVRDAAAPNHPVIGIAALSSSIVQQRQRDRWIGWDKDTTLAELQEHPTSNLARWLLKSLSMLITGVFYEDFVKEGVLTGRDLEEPSEDVLRRLNVLSLEERHRHERHVRGSDYRQRQANDDWEVLVATPLYRSKRALALYDLLSVRKVFREAGFQMASRGSLRRAANSPLFRQAVARLVRMVKAARVGINMMDISVAGAVAPYNALLGGKLVSLLMASPEVRHTYAKRYARMPSVIASAMKGQAVVRRPDLVLLCTTGLFAGGSSQYNRIRMPAEVVGGRGEIRFERLEENTAYGTFHISQATMREMMLYAEQWHNGSKVRGIFGEGVNPKMRKIRDMFCKLKVPQDELLRTGSPRALYVIPLAHNFRDVLLGRAAKAKPILPDDDPPEATQSIVAFWRERWLRHRISQLEVLLAVERNTLTYPIRHGAVVSLPHLEDDEQVTLDALSYEMDDVGADG